MQTKTPLFPQRKKAFTLVELIIVITILAILATIAFVSFQGYSAQSRDSNRVATVKNIENGVNIFITKTGKVPEPDDVIGSGKLTTDGPVLNIVGKVGAGISRSINLNETPLDPRAQEQYWYGVDTLRRYFQVGLTLESETAFAPGILPSYAGNILEAKVQGNYEYPLKLENIVYSLPSLLFLGSGGVLSNQTEFVVDEGNNVPYTFGQAKSGTQSVAEVLKIITGTGNLSLTGVSLPTMTMSDYKASTGSEIPSAFSGVAQLLGITDKNKLGVVVYGKEFVGVGVNTSSVETINFNSENRTVYGDEDIEAISACNKWVENTIGSSAGGYQNWVWVPARHFITDGHGTPLTDDFYKREVLYNGISYTCNGFAVMKYEAKFASTSGKSQPDLRGTWAVNDYTIDNDTYPENLTNGIVSKASDYPIGFIRHGEAIQACGGLSHSGKLSHLITNNEWMAIARNIEAQSVNLKDGNKLYRGFNGGAGRSSEDGTLGCGHEGSPSTYPYWTAPAGIDNNSLSSTRTSCDDMRQNKLSNGQIVWDIAGNSNDQVNKSNIPNTSNDRYNNSGWNTNLYSTEAMCNNSNSWSTYGWYGGVAYSMPICNMINGYTKLGFGPLNDWNAFNGVGSIYATNTESRSNIFLRGGSGYLGVSSGVFTLSLHRDDSSPYTSVGFRCSY